MNDTADRAVSLALDAGIDADAARVLIQDAGIERASACFFIVGAFNLNPGELDAVERGLAH